MLQQNRQTPFINTLSPLFEYSGQLSLIIETMAYFSEKQGSGSSTPTARPPHWTLAPRMTSWTITPRKIGVFVLAVLLLYSLSAFSFAFRPHQVSTNTMNHSLLLTLHDSLGVHYTLPSTCPSIRHWFLMQPSNLQRHCLTATPIWSTLSQATSTGTPAISHPWICILLSPRFAPTGSLWLRQCHPEGELAMTRPTCLEDVT